MKHALRYPGAALALSFALSTTGCVELDAPPDPSLVEDPALRASNPDERPADTTVSEAAGPAAGPECGNGTQMWWEWVCHWGAGWQLEIVGYRQTSCAQPYFGPMVGRTTGCKSADQIVCGGGDDKDGACAFDVPSSCQQPPSSYCYKRPPTPPIPPGPPPENAP